MDRGSTYPVLYLRTKFTQVIKGKRNPTYNGSTGSEASGPSHRQQGTQPSRVRTFSQTASLRLNVSEGHKGMLRFHKQRLGFNPYHNYGITSSNVIAWYITLLPPYKKDDHILN